MRVPLLVAAALAAAAPPAAADSITPVRLSIKVAPIARVNKPLRIAVAVGADPGVLDIRTAPLRVEVKLAGECGGSFETTEGTTLLDRALTPQPTTDRPYAARARGSGRPRSYGVRITCVYLEEEGDDRVFASDQSIQVNVSKACTLAAARYDHHRRSGRLRRAARRACGPGVAL